MSDPIEITGLVKTYGRIRALDGLDLIVNPGEVHGFCSSTTIRPGRCC